MSGWTREHASRATRWAASLSPEPTASRSTTAADPTRTRSSRSPSRRWTLWAHGAFGHTPPDVAALLADEARGYDRVAGLRVEQRSGFHQWLVAHLSLTLVRMRTVVIEGQLVKDP